MFKNEKFKFLQNYLYNFLSIEHMVYLSITFSGLSYLKLKIFCVFI